MPKPKERSSASALPPCGTEYLTRKQAAAYANLSPQTLDKLIKTRKLRAFKPARKVLIRKADIAKAMEAAEL